MSTPPPADIRAAVSAPGHEDAGNPRRRMSPPWADLRSELLGLVLLRLPSLGDRVRFRAVCRSWLAAARLERQRLPPPFPWFALRDGTLVDLEGEPIRCEPILSKTDLGYLSADNLAFVVHNDDGDCSLMNPISRLVTPLPKLAEAVNKAIDWSDVRAIDGSKYYTQGRIRKAYEKVILSAPLDSSPDPLIAAEILTGNALVVSYCKRDEAATGLSLYPKMFQGDDEMAVNDIAFLCGKLYTLSEDEGLQLIQLDASSPCSVGDPEESLFFHKCIPEDPKQLLLYGFDTKDKDRYVVLRYLVESHGRLFLVRRWMNSPRHAPILDTTTKFEVFKADLTTVPGRWVEVDSLGGNAFFLDSECSKSVSASNCAGGVQEDCIYFMHRIFNNPAHQCFDPCLDPFGDSGIYNMKDRTIIPLLPEAVMIALRRKRMWCTWFFPANV